jgi:hypothetical protein
MCRDKILSRVRDLRHKHGRDVNNVRYFTSLRPFANSENRPGEALQNQSYFWKNNIIWSVCLYQIWFCINGIVLWFISFLCFINELFSLFLHNFKVPQQTGTSLSMEGLKMQCPLKMEWNTHIWFNKINNMTYEFVVFKAHVCDASSITLGRWRGKYVLSCWKFQDFFNIVCSVWYMCRLFGHETFTVVALAVHLWW